MKNIFLFFLFIIISFVTLAQSHNIDSINTKIQEYQTFNYSNVVYEDNVKGLHFMNVIKEIKLKADCSLDIIYYSDWRFISQKESEVSYNIPMDQLKVITYKKPKASEGYKQYTHSIVLFQCNNDENKITGNLISQKNEDSKDDKEKTFKISAIGFAYEGDYLEELLGSLNSIRERCSKQ